MSGTEMDKQPRRAASPTKSGRTDEALWERCKQEAIARLAARAMQFAGRLYREAGGRYTGRRTRAQRNLAKWTKERWRTATGEKACRRTQDGLVCDRYLPDAAWGMLSPGEVNATRRKKRSATQQYVPNTPAAREAARRARKR